MYQVKGSEGFEGMFSKVEDAILYACELAATFPPERFTIERNGNVLASYRADASSPLRASDVLQ